ncbi:MAG TPA: hypothetical protein VM689_07950 [Aliidongia sp.]|nr:hypothetical protein [Aliidongia sp.]
MTEQSQTALDALIRQTLDELLASPEQPAPWLTMFMLLARKRDARNLLSIVNTRMQRRGDPLTFIFTGLRELHSAKADAEALWVADLMLPNPATAPLALRACGSVATRARAWASAGDLMRQASAALDRAVAAVPSDTIFRTQIAPLIAAQGRMIEAPEAIRSLRRPERSPAIEWLDPPPADGALVLFACADLKYLKLFGPGLAESFRRTQRASSILHLHAVSNDAEAMTLLQAIKDTDGRIRTSIEWATGKSAYYACSRFLIAPQMFVRYPGRPLIGLDMDMILERPFDLLLTPTDMPDIGRFTLPDAVLPSLAPLACITLMNPTPAALDYVLRLDALIERNLELPCNWMLDQAAIFSLERLNEIEPFYRLIDFSEIFEGYIGGFADLPKPEGKMDARLSNL